jgi:hypothetical protein
LIDIAEHLPMTAVFAPWVATVVGSTIARVRGAVETSRLKTMTALTGQLTATAHGGQVSYRTRDGAQWTVTVGIPAPAAAASKAVAPGAATP